MGVPFQYWVKEVSGVQGFVLLSICLPSGAGNVVVGCYVVVLYGSVVKVSVHIKALVNIDFKNSNGRLLYG